MQCTVHVVRNPPTLQPGGDGRRLLVIGCSGFQVICRQCESRLVVHQIINHPTGGREREICAHGSISQGQKKKGRENPRAVESALELNDGIDVLSDPRRRVVINAPGHNETRRGATRTAVFLLGDAGCYPVRVFLPQLFVFRSFVLLRPSWHRCACWYGWLH